MTRELLVSPFAEATGDKPHPPSSQAMTPPAPTTGAVGIGTFPSRSKFPSIGGVPQRGGVVREFEIIHLLFCHSRAGGNRVWIVISYLIRGITLCCVFIYL